MYVKYTYVDNVTGRVATATDPAVNGPAVPKVKNLVFGFALESQYPTNTPTFFGTCQDGTDPRSPGILAVLTEAEYTTARTNEMSLRLTLAKNKAYEALKQRRKACELKGVTVTQLGDVAFSHSISIPAEKDDQDRVNTVLSSMERWPDVKTVSFKAANNNFIVVNHDQLSQIGLAMVTHVQKCFDNEMKHNLAINALMTCDAVESYDVGTGWPS